MVIRAVSVFCCLVFYVITLAAAIKRLTATVSNRQALALKPYAIQCVLHNGVFFSMVVHELLPISAIEI